VKVLDGLIETIERKNPNFDRSKYAFYIRPSVCRMLGIEGDSYKQIQIKRSYFMPSNNIILGKKGFDERWRKI